MADDLQAGAEDSTVEAAPPAASDKPAKKTAAKKSTAKKAPAKKTAAKKPAKKAAAAPVEAAAVEAGGDTPAPTVKKTARKTTKKVAAEPTASTAEPAAEPTAGPTPDADPSGAPAVLFQAPAKTTVSRRTRKSAQPAPAAEETAEETAEESDEAAEKPATKTAAKKAPAKKTTAKKTAAKKTTAKKTTARSADESDEGVEAPTEEPTEGETGDTESGENDGEPGAPRRRRRRGGRRRRKPGDGEGGQAQDDTDDAPGDDAADEAGSDTGPDTGPDSSSGEGTSRRRRRRRRTGDDGGDGDDSESTVTRVRSRRSAEDEITAISGSTRLEAKKQRRRDGREAGRRRAPIVSEAEFLARRESVDRVMVVRQHDDLTQIAVLEDRVLVEHYVARESQTSLIGNVYLGRVQNVLPSMEAAFIDIGKGRNAVLYAGEVNWSALGHKDGQPRKIESVLSSGQAVLVQVTKDPIGHKGARLTSQVSLAGRFLVYVPDGTTSGISRKLPDTERNRLKALLKEIVPDTAGVIVRTAAEGATEDELTRDVERLKARWEDIEAKSRGNAPQLLYGEPDLTLKVVRDLFTEDFAKLVIQGDDAWDTVSDYVAHVAPDLQERLSRYEPGADGSGGKADVFAEYRVDEQIAKGLDRKVWLPSGGSLVIDRTEAMTVVDVNTGKFTGSGGNLEETVTKNNLEAAEEIVRQLRLRDIGGIIVVDFIDMVLESNRDLVLRRMVECLGRDRTRHQVAEVTSLGLVQMTRKRIGTGLLEAFSENCEHCHGRGVVVQDRPVEPSRGEDDSRRGGGGGSTSGRRGRRGRGEGAPKDQPETPKTPPSPKDLAAMPRPEPTAEETPTAADTATVVAATVETPEIVAPEVETPAVETAAVESTPVEAPPAVAVAPEKPKVTTRSRRRSASRPAGEPAAVAESAPEPAPIVVEVAPAVASAGEPEVEAPAAPEPPRVVTRTRTRSASRPAGPPAGEPIGSVGTPPDHGAIEPGTAEDGSHVEHVPIKKKGSRKR